MSQAEAQFFRSFSDGMPFGVCLVDLQGKIVYWNMAAESISGYMGQEVLGRTYRRDLLIHCEGNGENTEVQCPVTDVLRDGRPTERNLYLRHKQGHRVPIHLFAFPLRNSLGELQGAGEIFDPSRGKQESPGWVGHPDREFEMATGLPAVAESKEQLQMLRRSRAASTSALILIEMSEQHAIQQHGGTAMLHQAIRVLAKTVAGLLPSRNYIGCWTDWRLIAIVPECGPETLEKLKSTLSVVGSSCAVKWWGDRVVIGIRAAARHVDLAQTEGAQIEQLEQDLKNAADRKE